MTEHVEVPVRVLNETPTVYLLTQEPYSRQDGVWIEKAAVEWIDRRATAPHFIARLPADLAARKRLGPTMKQSRPAPSPWRNDA